MSEIRRFWLPWLLLAIALVSAAALTVGGSPADAADDHDAVRELRQSGEAVPLSELLTRAELVGLRVLEAKLEREHGRLVYELELLDPGGHVHELYYDAATGRPLNADKGE